MVPFLLVHQDSFSTACGDNLLNQMDCHLRTWHGGDFALQTAGPFPVDGFIQESE